MTLTGIQGYKWINDNRLDASIKTIDFANTCLRVGGGFEEDILVSPLHTCSVGNDIITVSKDAFKKVDFSERKKRIRIPSKAPFGEPEKGRVRFGGEQKFYKQMNFHFSESPRSFIKVGSDGGLNWTVV